MRRFATAVPVDIEPIAHELLVEARLLGALDVGIDRQKRDESGVSTSSPKMIVPSTLPNSSFVSAMMMPRSRACSGSTVVELQA